MATLVLSHDTRSVSLHSERIRVTRHATEPDAPPVTRDVPLNDVDRVIVIGRPPVTMAVLCELLDRGIPCFLTTAHHRWRGSLLPDNNLNAARRIRQFEQGTDPAFSLRIARRLIHAKVRNSRRVLQRLAANRGMTGDDAHVHAADALGAYAREVLAADSLDVVRGIEGIAAAIYFRELGRYFPESLPFTTRTRRPPRDPANALLSFGYSLLYGEMECAVRMHGLDAAIGHLHADKTNTPALALDLIEPLRAPVVDLLVLNIVNHLMVKADGNFEVSETDGGTYLNSHGRRSYLIVYENAMLRHFALSKGQPHTTLRQVLDQQVRLYLKALEQNQDPDFFFLP